MGGFLTAAEALDGCFLEARCRIIEVAAALDRIDRGAGDVAADPRLAELRRAVAILLEDRPDRAEACQMVFSLSFEGSKD